MLKFLWNFNMYILLLPYLFIILLRFPILFPTADDMAGPLCSEIMPAQYKQSSLYANSSVYVFLSCSWYALHPISF